MSDVKILSSYVSQDEHPVSSPASTVEALTRLLHVAPDQHVLEPVYVVRQSALPLQLEIRKADESLKAELRLEGTERAIILECSHHIIHMPESLPLGYHDLRLLKSDEIVATSAYIVTPSRVYFPPEIEGEQRIWGVSAQLYALRSKRNWGIGDFTDLSEFAEEAGRAGAALLGLNPLHALFPDEPTRCSPYAPSSRRFLNIIYLDCEAIPDFAECEPARHLRNSADFIAALEQLQRNELVDYAQVTGLKRSILEILFRHFHEAHIKAHSDRAREFEAYQNSGGSSLHYFALFQVLREHFRESGIGADWRSWPSVFQNSRSPEVEAFAQAQSARIAFFQYLQWQAHAQFGRSGIRAKNAGLSIGLYTDLAVSVAPDSFEVWERPDDFLKDWSIGAPPDMLNRVGQNWGLPPPHPVHIQASAYHLFRETMAVAMRETGALRIDHVLGLLRLFLIPPNEGASQGAYVMLPVRDLFSIVALESQRHRCMVVGEDLGTVPDGFEQILRDYGVLSYRVLYFEKDHAGSFYRARDWLVPALASVSTHDLAPLSGFLQGTDIETKQSLNLFAATDRIDDFRLERKNDLEALMGAVNIDGRGVAIADIVTATYEFLAQTASKIAMVQIEDLALMTKMMNLPGTVDQHPNWRRKLPGETFELFSTPLALDIFNAMRKARGRSRMADWKPDRQIAERPISTYRLQFGPDFTFRDACKVVPYLRALGISHVYASPYLKARPGSTHGYDITDHNALNPQIGTPADFEFFCQTLRDHGIGQILDFVPNHMGVGKADNSLWLDVLEWGQMSPYARFFDINWQSTQADLQGRVLLPLLGDHYGKILENGEFNLRYDSSQGSFAVWYHEHCLPIHPADYAEFIATAAPRMRDENLKIELENLAQAFSFVPWQWASVESARDTQSNVQEWKRNLADLSARFPEIATAFALICDKFNAAPQDCTGIVAFHELLERQNYRVAFWRVASDDINFRRFFDINELAAIRMEDGEVFNHTHRFVGHLISTQIVQGLRLDHVDGLFDPRAYLTQLQEFCQASMRDRSGVPFYVVVEKILASHEHLPPAWPVSGTTGYDFLALLGGLYVDPKGEGALTRLYDRITKMTGSVSQLIYACKLQILEHNLASELNCLAALLHKIALQDWNTRDYTFEHLRRALREIIAHFPVYRTYVSAQGYTQEDRNHIAWAVAGAHRTYQGADRDILDFIARILTLDISAAGGAILYEDVLLFAMRMQQLTSPVMAKSVEDTAFYRYHRLISLNEVGNELGSFAVSPQAFHRAMRERAKYTPQALNASTTHDTKRAEDVRLRLHVLSQIPLEWTRRVRRWDSLNRFFRRESGGEIAPAPNDEYLIYQTLLGAWPLDAANATDVDDKFAARVRATLLKSLREAKQRTSWSNPDLDYEDACDQFLTKLLDHSRVNPFLDDFIPFAQKIARIGAFESLSHLTIKLTAPGVCDIYQGTELFDFSMVDPDNRRPVDYVRREQNLTHAPAERAHWAELCKTWRNGQIKLHMTAALLNLRRQHPDLFLSGSYRPVDVTGDKSGHVIAFLREHKHETCLVVAGRLFAPLMSDGDQLTLTSSCWSGHAVEGLGEDSHWRDVLTNRMFHADAGRMALDELLGTLGVCVLVSA